MRFEIVTLFPELIDAFAGVGLIARGIEGGVLSIEALNPRQFATDKHGSVDDAPFGGGSGMVMLPEPLLAAFEALDARAAETGRAKGRRILLSPSGDPFTQATAARLASLPAVMLICGRYEGVDERVAELCDEQLSLGDFVLNGGEVAAMAVIEATARLLPGVLGNASSALEESHSAGVLEYPQYTRPRSFRGREVPAALLSGNHAAIARWRRAQALARTRARRPDLFARLTLDASDRALLAQHDREAQVSDPAQGDRKPEEPKP
jgi:tRNA (guanine37-N1)-methyltransferase